MRGSDRRWLAFWIVLAVVGVLAAASLPLSRAWNIPAPAVAAAVAVLGVMIAFSVLFGLLRSHPSLAGVTSYLGVIAVGTVGTGLVASQTSTAAIRSATAVALIVTAIGIPVQRLTLRLAARWQPSNKVECALRPAPPADFSRDRWEHGTLQLHAGKLTFRSAGPAGRRFHTGTVRSLQIESISVDEDRRPSWHQVWTIAPWLHIVEAHSDDHLVQLAARPTDLLRLRSWLTRHRH